MYPLQLSDANPSDEDITTALVELLASATRDLEPKESPSEIYQVITKMRCHFAMFASRSYRVLSNDAKALDQTDVGHIENASRSTPCNDPPACDIMAVNGECGSGKEVVMAVQEAIAQLKRLLNLGPDEAIGDNDDRLGRSDDKEECPSIAGKIQAEITYNSIDDPN